MDDLEALELAAFHEAAHAALATRSSYHEISGALIISPAGAGTAPIGASREKLLKANKPIASALLLTDAEYIRELVRILFPGVLAEEIRAQEVSTDRILHLNLTISGAPDLNYAQKVMSDASLNFEEEKDTLKAQSESLVRQEWKFISMLAEAMLADPSVPLSSELIRFAAGVR